MASVAAMAIRRSAARDRLNTAMAALSEKTGVPIPPAGFTAYKQPELREASELERLATFVEDVVRGGPTPEVVPPADDESGDETPGDTDTEDEHDDEPEGEGDEPTFAGQPLSYYDGMTDEEIRADKTVRVGVKTLAKIREAQKAAK